MDIISRGLSDAFNMINVLGPVASADWWENGNQIVTASWDRTVKLWDVEKSTVIHTLEGTI